MADSASAGGTTAMPLTSPNSSFTPKATSPETSSPDGPPNVKTAPAAQQHQPDGHILGLRKETGRPINAQHVFSDDYEKLLPEDEYGQEAAPNARVWRAYEQEAATYDTVMIGQARDGLDVMLVFAGLFSAVVTSFLVQVSQNLQPDFPEMTALLLHDLVVMQMQTAEGGAPSPNITVPSADPTAEFTPDALDVWVNGLWVVSLAISLTVALSAVLVKQWLHRYMALPSGTAGLRSHTRHFRFVGFEEWHVEAIIGTLPIVMHLSLALFFAGLVLFYVPLRLSLACTLGALSVIVLALYISSNVIPLFRPQCPYQTPLTDSIPYLVLYSTSIGQKAREFGSTTAQKVTRTRLGRFLTQIRLARAATLPVDADAGTIGATSTSSMFAPPSQQPSVPMSSRQREIHAVELGYDELSVDAMHWLFHMTSNPAVHNLVFQAIPGLPFEIRDYARSKWQNDEVMLSKRFDLLRLKTPPDNSEFWLAPLEDPTVERLLRSAIFLPYSPNYSPPWQWGSRRYTMTPRLLASFWLPHNIDCPPSLGIPVPHTEVEIAESLLRTLWPLYLQNSELPLNLWKDFISRALECIDVEGLAPQLVAQLLTLLLPVMGVNPREHFLLQDVMHLMHVTTCTSLRRTIFASLEQSSLLSPFVEQTDRQWMGHLFGSREAQVFASTFRFVLHHHPTHEHPGSTAPSGATPYQALLLRILEYLLIFQSWDTPSDYPDTPPWINLLFDEQCPVIDMLINSLDSWDLAQNTSVCFMKLLDMYSHCSQLESFRFPSLPKIFAGVLRGCLIDARGRVLSATVDSSQRYLFSRQRAYVVLGITRSALSRGHTEVYRDLINRGWLPVICEFAMLTGPDAGEGELRRVDRVAAGVLAGFTTGLPRLPLEDRARHLEVLQQRHNLQTATVILLCSSLAWETGQTYLTIRMMVVPPSDDHDHDLSPQHSVLEMIHSLHAWLKYQALPATERDPDQIEPEFPLQNVVGILDSAASGDDPDRLLAMKKALIAKTAMILDNGLQLLDLMEEAGVGAGARVGPAP